VLIVLAVYEILLYYNKLIRLTGDVSLKESYLNTIILIGWIGMGIAIFALGFNILYLFATMFV
jgi:hypothetical protein